MSEHAGDNDRTFAGQPVPRSVFDTRGLPSRKAFALWQEQLDHLAEAGLAKEPDGFHVLSEAVILDRLVLGRTRTSTHVYDRSRFRVARDSIDHYMLHFFRHGRMICRKTGAGETTMPGDMVLADLANPELLTLVDLDVANIVIPRALLAPLLIEPDAQEMRYFSRDNILVKLLYDQVNTLYAQSQQVTVEQAGALMPALLEMAAAAINGGVRDETRHGVSSTLRQAIRRYVCVHALAAESTPERIASRFGISPRNLSYLFQEDGGIATYIQRERLRQARLALMDPAQRGRTIAEIAEAHGFAHRTSFIRAFERTYGLTPSQQRAVAAERRSKDKDVLSHPSPIKWIGHF